MFLRRKVRVALWTCSLDSIILEDAVRHELLEQVLYCGSHGQSSNQKHRVFEHLASGLCTRCFFFGELLPGTTWVPCWLYRRHNTAIAKNPPACTGLWIRYVKILSRRTPRSGSRTFMCASMSFDSGLLSTMKL